MAHDGRLVLVGTGMLPGHVTQETRAALERADEVRYVAAAPLAAEWLRRLRPDSRSLHRHYAPDKPRTETYAEMADELLTLVSGGARVCAAFYGHPGVLVDPARYATARVRSNGYAVRMLPAVSSLDCLFVDLEIDPARGCQSYEATSFLVTRRTPDTSAVLVLWQIGALGQAAHVESVSPAALQLLADRLCEIYPGRHEAIVYEAATFPGCDPVVQRVTLSELADAEVGGMATLVVPAATEARPDPVAAASLRLS
jgi:uncharacterized protein YabN with tetrapyrrole methylase and pyrophosphatase domain